MTSKGRKTANSQGRRKGRITRSMANEANHEETAAPQQNSELGKQGLGTRRGWEELGHGEWLLLGFPEVGVNCGSLWLEFRPKRLPAELTVTWGIHSFIATPRKNIRDSNSLDTGRI